jgi:hypothetical protein
LSRTPTERVNASTASPRHAHTAPNATNAVTTSPPHISTVSKRTTASSTPPPPSQGAGPSPASPNDRVAPTGVAPTSPKPTTALSTGDIARTAAQIAAKGGIRKVIKLGKEDTKEVRTTANTASDDTTYLAPSSFDWAEDVNTTGTPTPIALVTPAARAPRDFSALRSSTQNPWGSLSRRHRRSQPCTRNSFYSCQYNTNYSRKPTAPPPPTLPLQPAPIQLVETIRHPHGIAPTKPVIKTTALSPAGIPPTHPSTSTSSREPIPAVHSDSPLQSTCAFSLDWSGDPLLAGLARILEALGWVRDHSAARTPLCLRGAHGVVAREERTL